MTADRNILYVTSYAPSTERPRAWNILRGLARHFRISLVCQVRSEAERERALAMRDYAAPVEPIMLPRWRSWMNCILRLPTTTPLRAAYFHNRQARRAIERRLSISKIDLIHVEHMMAAHLVADLTGVTRSFDTLDSITRLQRKILANARNPIQRLLSIEELFKLRRYEPALVRKFDAVLTSTELDREAIGIPDIRVVPNGVDLDYYQPVGDEPDADAILFYGRLSYVANADAIGYFLDEVFPAILRLRPSTKLSIVGPSAPKRVVQAASDCITVAGRVDDVRGYIGRASVVVCPVRFAVGTQNKVLEPMAMGVPVVGTNEAIAGMQVEPERDLLVADTPEEFAKAVVRLLEDGELRTLIARHGTEYVQNHHDWRPIVDDLAGFYRDLMAKKGEAKA